MELREQIQRILEYHGVDIPGGSIHSWRCERPEVYGRCDCFKELIDELQEMFEQHEE